MFHRVVWHQTLPPDYASTVPLILKHLMLLVRTVVENILNVNVFCALCLTHNEQKE